MEKRQEEIKNYSITISISDLLPLDQCPHCKTRMDEDWEDERDENGELTGYAFEILSCCNCGYTEQI